MRIKNPFENKNHALYIHIPFCVKKCYYCAFNVNILNNIPEKQYIDKLKEELCRHREKKWKTIYIGGGTPNLLSDEFYKELFKNINTKEVEEITIELNPEFVNREQIDFYKSLGINRFSLGIQTFDNFGLEILGRNHNKDEALNSLKILKDENYSFDLIYGYPKQTLISLNDDLNAIEKLQPPHVSVYNLSYEEGAFFYKWKNKGRIKPLDDEIELEMYKLISERLKNTGLKRYEISNFAKEGYESKHNMVYWTSYPYIGIGTGAHSYYYENGNIVRSEKEKVLRKYLKKTLTDTEYKYILSQKEYVFDKFYSEMRKLYINTDEFFFETGINLFEFIVKSGYYKNIEDLIVFNGSRLEFTDKGIINSDIVFEVFYRLIYE